MTIKVDKARAAIADLEAHVDELNIPAEIRSGIKSDIATIKAQLSKDKPSHPVMHESFHAIRDKFESVVREVSTPAVITAITEVGKAIGAF